MKIVKSLREKNTGMKLGVISDTHDNLEMTKAAVDFLEEKVDTVIHCGDMVAPFTAKLFNADFTFHAVRGNNDGEWNLKETIEEFGEFYNNIAELTFSEKQIAVYHGTEEKIVEALVDSGNYEYVIRGHSHERKFEEKDGVYELNPGGIKFPDQEEEFSVAILNVEKEEVEFFTESDF